MSRIPLIGLLLVQAFVGYRPDRSQRRLLAHPSPRFAACDCKVSAGPADLARRQDPRSLT